MKKNIFYIACFVLLSSCTTMYYNTNLIDVEKPVNINKPYGDHIIVPIQEINDMVTQYEDDNISIVWKATKAGFEFLLKNKTNNSIKILWDEAVYVDPTGISRRCVHKGMPLSVGNTPQIPTVIAKNTEVADILIIDEEIKHVKSSTSKTTKETEVEVSHSPFGYYSSQSQANKCEFIGKSYYIVLPVVIEDVKVEYIFHFKLNSITIK